jgi:sigma-E factor negative regulatory protein RseC
MLSEPARVVAVAGERIQLETSRKAACNKCGMKSGCGQYLFGPARETLWLGCQDIAASSSLPPSDLVPGMQLVLGMQENAVASLALLFYCLPLLFLMLFTLLGSLWTSSEVGLAALALAGLLAGFVLMPAALRIVTTRTRCTLELRSAMARDEVKEYSHES